VSKRALALVQGIRRNRSFARAEPWHCQRGHDSRPCPSMKARARHLRSAARGARSPLGAARACGRSLRRLYAPEARPPISMNACVVAHDRGVASPPAKLSARVLVADDIALAAVLNQPAHTTLRGAGRVDGRQRFRRAFEKTGSRIDDVMNAQPDGLCPGTPRCARSGKRTLPVSLLSARAVQELRWKPWPPRRRRLPGHAVHVA